MPELTTVTTVQSYLGDSGADAGLLTTMIGAAERRIAQLCGRVDPSGNHWLSATHTDRLDGEQARNVVLKFTPITAITSVNITTGASSSISVTLTNLECDGIAVASLSSSVPGTLGRLGWRSQGPALTSDWFGQGYPEPSSWPFRDQPNYGTGESTVVVVYTGGHSSAPADLSMAATIIAAQMYREKSRNPNVTSESLGDWSIAYGSTDIDDNALGQVKDLLAPYLSVSA